MFCMVDERWSYVATLSNDNWEQPGGTFKAELVFGAKSRKQHSGEAMLHPSTTQNMNTCRD